MDKYPRSGTFSGCHCYACKTHVNKQITSLLNIMKKNKTTTQNKVKNHLFACMHNQQAKQNDSPGHLSGSLGTILEHSHVLGAERLSG